MDAREGEMMCDDIDFTHGVPRTRWRRFAFDSEHGPVIRERVTRERAALGLPAHVVVLFDGM